MTKEKVPKIKPKGKPLLENDDFQDIVEKVTDEEINEVIRTAHPEIKPFLQATKVK